MMNDLSGATIVIFIALGALVLFILFIFGKRQIMRFALRSRRGPHVPVGHSAPRSLRKEIERRLDLIGRIKQEPKQILETTNCSTDQPSVGSDTYCRMQAMDDVKVLEIQLHSIDSKATRMPGENLRTFLISQLTGVLRGCQPKSIHQLCDLYERARFSPDGFSTNHLDVYRQLLANCVQVAQSNKISSTSPKLGVATSKSKKKKDTTIVTTSL